MPWDFAGYEQNINKDFSNIKIFPGTGGVVFATVDFPKVWLSS